MLRKIGLFFCISSLSITLTASVCPPVHVPAVTPDPESCRALNNLPHDPGHWTIYKDQKYCGKQQKIKNGPDKYFKYTPECRKVNGEICELLRCTDSDWVTNFWDKSTWVSSSDSPHSYCGECVRNTTEEVKFALCGLHQSKLCFPPSQYIDINFVWPDCDCGCLVYD